MMISLSEKDRVAYARYQDDLRYQASLVESNYGLGRLGGREEGKEIGREEGRQEGGKCKPLEVATKMKQKGATLEDIMDLTGLTKEEIKRV